MTAPLTSSSSFNPPPPFQARELSTLWAPRVRLTFQSTPAFSGEGTFIERYLRVPEGFQSTPAFSGEGTTGRQEGDKLDRRFNPPPPFQARELFGTRRHGIINRVSIHPRLFRRGNLEEADSHLMTYLVSIHPRLFRRGNFFLSFVSPRTWGFQSTPAFSGEGTKPNSMRPNTRPCFNPPPPFQAREPLVSRLRTLKVAVSIHPRLFRRGNS